MKHKVIYTCLTGGYDELRQPIAVHPDWDYICFSDCLPLGQNGVWNVLPIPYSGNNPIFKSRYPKILPNECLSEYEYSLYIDANLQINNAKFYNRLESLIQHDVLIANVNHPIRDCIYKEILECCDKGLESIFVLSRQWKQLKSRKYPTHWGLYENNVIFRKHNHPAVIRAMESWWKQFHNICHRDQLSLCFVYWQQSIHPELIFPSDICARNTSELNCFWHPKRLSFGKRCIKKLKRIRSQLLMRLISVRYFPDNVRT